MKKKISFLSLLAIIALTSCGGNNPKLERMSLVDMSTLLESTLISNEINKSSKVDFIETYTKEGISIETNLETLSIYNGYTSYAEGSNKIEYTNETKVVEDTYKRIIQVKKDSASNQDLFFYVTDYEGNGTKREAWKDSAYILPVAETGTSESDGVDYILRSSLKYQLSKQVSLIASNFIANQFTSNASVSASLPTGYVETKGEDKTYYIEPFGYSYEEEGITTNINVSFNFVTKNDNLISFETNYVQTETRGKDDKYEIKQETKYNLSYENKVSTPSDLIDPEDYFLQNVDEIKAFYFDDSSKKTYVSVLELPCNKYVQFEANVYSPSKAVDLTMYPNGEDASLDENIISLSGSAFYTNKAGTTKVKLMSLTGITKEIDVKVLPVKITKINYTDVSSGIEHKDGNSYVYGNTTYSNIVITLSPSQADYEDLSITVDNDQLVKISTSIAKGKYLEITLEVKEVNEGDTFTLTIASKTYPSVNLSKTFICKRRMNQDEMLTYLKEHTYTFTSLYIDLKGVLTFTSDNAAHVIYTNKAGSQTYAEADFTFTIEGDIFKPTITTKDPYYDYNDGKILLDLSEINLYVLDEDGSTMLYNHNFKVNK